MQVHVNYAALGNAATFNTWDWRVFADGRLIDNYTYVSHGPKPELGSGQLPDGRTASGWMVWEIPAQGEILLAYAPNYEGAPVFEIALRQ